MKRFLTLIFVFIMLISLSITAFAAGNDPTKSEDFSHNYNVTTECPWDRVSTYGVNPPTEGWDVSTQGVYTFSGKASYSTLYLSKLIYGSAYYAVSITNRSLTNILKVTPHDVIPTADFEVAADDDFYDEFEQKPGTTYFSLTFYAPSDFEGSIGKCAYQ